MRIKGVTAYIQQILWVKDGDSLGGNRIKPEDAFADLEGGDHATTGLGGPDDPANYQNTEVDPFGDGKPVDVDPFGDSKTAEEDVPF
jgi:hypothetical protein